VEVFAASTVILSKTSIDNFEGVINSKKYLLKKTNNKWELLIDNKLIYAE